MNFTVYSKEGCPYCSAIIQVLVGKDFQFTEYKLDEDFSKDEFYDCLLYTSPSPRDGLLSRMPSSA